MAAKNESADPATAWYAKVDKHFSPLYDEYRAEGQLMHSRPLLAHYTSIETLDRVLRTNEIWFSNPLFMDDIQEVRFGITEGNSQFVSSAAVRKACGSDARAEILMKRFEHYYLQFANDQVMDVYVPVCANVR